MIIIVYRLILTVSIIVDRYYQSKSHFSGNADNKPLLLLLLLLLLLA